MRFFLIIGFLLVATGAFADVSVVASVDQNHISFGESVTLTVTVQGADNAEPSIPNVGGLTLSGPSTSTSLSWVNGQTSKSASYTYQVTPGRPGEFTIPAISVNAGGKSYLTEPIKLVVEKGGTQGEAGQTLFGRINLSSQQVYIGQTAPLDVYILWRAEVPIRGLSGFNYEAEGLGYKFIPTLKPGSQIINGESFNVGVIRGAISPTSTGTINFGPCILKTQLAVPNRGGDAFFNDMFGRTQVREVPITIDAVPITVLPLPEEGRPADFSGAVGQWNLEVTAKPTEVAVGDPITFTIKISGNGNIDTVPTPKLGALDEFKTYEPSTKTTKDELNTTGERVIQQVLIARSPEVKQLPEVRLVYFDPMAKAYKTAVQSPMKLVVKAGSVGQSTIVSGGNRLRPEEKLGQDIVYLKGDLGPVTSTAPFCATPTFWALNTMPVLALLGGIGWKKRTDKFRSDIAYARRVRAARDARKLLAAATSYDEIQHALQNYLGDRLNIPAAGMTTSVVDEQLLPRGLNSELAAELKACFEVCDTARFAGGSAGATLATTREKMGRLIDELEKTIYNVIVLIWLLGLSAAIAAPADDFKAANQLYDSGKFAEAAVAYEKIEPKTAHLYYNLGNAWFRQNKLGLAILNYARARQLAPRDPDILANLKFAQQRLGVEDVNTPPRAMQRFLDSVIESRTTSEWSAGELVGLWLLALAIGARVYFPRLRTGILIVAVAGFVGFGFATFALSYQLIADHTAPQAIVVTGETEARFAPVPDSTVHFRLAEGTRVAIREDRGQWLFVDRTDGQQGWVKSETIGRIANF